MAVQIVAEIGSNHEGQLQLALDHIYAAAQAGCDAVKFQIWTRPDRLDSRPEVQETLARAQLRFAWLDALRNLAHQEGLKFIVTPFDLHACEMLLHGVDAVKISAYDLTYDALLEAAAALKVPLILSTAMATEDEIHHALDVVGFDRKDVTLLQGVAAYPAFEEHYNLGVIVNRARSWGVSDHTLGFLVPQLAAALGASLIEKHFSLPRMTDSPDYPHSFHPYQMRHMVQAVRHVERIMGTGEKTGPLPCELPLYETCRRTNDKPIRGI